MNEWSKYPDTEPTISGYYLTYCYNMKIGLYKTLFWSNENKKWLTWRLELKSNDIIVKGFVEKSRNDYYVSCSKYAEQQVKEEFCED